ncbi:hypothetical protein IWZ03DRAFT_363275 [Phyllosticta citriasiana]|uniref:N-acetyltransferase domain-containing protein n=1 Tax=Phyllosticta citriasiana TaxID=595635 RepID=A0ABR1KD55_9PEZI
MASTTLASNTAIDLVEKPGLTKRKDSGSGITEPQPQFQNCGNGLDPDQQSTERVPDSAAAKASIPNSPKAVDDQVRIVQLSEYKAAARCLAEAFESDSVGRYFVDTPGTKDWTPEQKWDLHLFMMECITYCHIAQGMVTTIGPDYGGVALWMPPNSADMGLITFLRSGMWRLYYRLCREGRKRFFTEFMPLLHDIKAHTLGDRDASSWYLVYIGTKPAARGKGYARKLVDHVTCRADRESRAMYLESSNVANLPFYRRLGFKECRKLYLQRSEEVIELDIMVREPTGKGE